MRFHELKKYGHIFVTGPHRSGTTICARMIAHDTGHDLVLEDEFRCTNRSQFSAFLHSDYGPRVMQCPFLSNEIHDLEYLYDIDMSKVLVVFMHRYRKDIIDSEDNAPVDFESIGRGQKRAYHEVRNIHPSDIKYDAWEDQCRVIPNALDVGYESLKSHPLWDSDHKNLPFQHEVRQPVISGRVRDVIRTLSNI